MTPEKRIFNLERRLSAIELTSLPLGPRPEDPQEREETVNRILSNLQRVIEQEKLDMVRCKFVCSYKDGQNVHFSPVYTGSKENKQFFAATPGGQIGLYTVNQEALDRFEVGKEYYIDFTPATGS